MIVWGWWTRGAAATAAVQVVTGPYWAYATDSKPKRVYPPRARGSDVWVQTGDMKDPDPAVDTWEGEAT